MRYDQDWHSYYGDMTSRSADKMIAYLSSRFAVQSAVEFGCGHAHWLEAAQRAGIVDVKGLDGPWTELDQLRIPRELFEVADLEKPVDLKRKFELAICMEVGEHLHEAAAKVFVESIARHADLVLFGAAIPLQGGFRHINEKWQSFWADQFRTNGFQVFDIVRPVFWMDRDIHYYYRQNALVYIRSTSHELIDIGRLMTAELQTKPIIDLVHPEKYLNYASYDSIDLRRLLPMLPRSVWSAVKRRLPFMKQGL